ncbi:MAG TPA: tetratricopeptide repeat protein [Candidatus Aminicenantes bacterium]|nr:tetratricopeptide repeat protein [Candidatus Aminicenantes bacterium]HRY64038.1 tetratricopeptide repeat protein [Candidatus Aminicenantes bacterium]HRZ70951.1 tetratricopeptide repeat protein [Candidatus Aminicenantes bacterium]
MKRTLFATVTMILVLAGLAVAQGADEEYLKAMQLSDNCQKAKALEAYLAKYAGQGTTNEHWANAYFCLTPCASTDPVKAAAAGEKALTMQGIDNDTKVQLLATIPSLYNKAGQADKADAAAQKLIDFGKGQSNADLSAKLQAGGYVMIGQFAEKSGDVGKAAENYIKAYGIYKNPTISKQLNGLASSLYKSGKFAEAEQVFRQFYASDKGPESAALLGQTLYKQGKVDEALAIYKEGYAKRRTASLAQNIAVLLNAQVKTDPSKTMEAVTANIEAGLLIPAQQKNFLGMAQNLFVGQDKALASSYAKIEEHKKAIEEFNKTIDQKFANKTEDDLSDSDKRLLKTLNANIEAENQAIVQIQASQKDVLAKFNALVAQVKARMGK